MRGRGRENADAINGHWRYNNTYIGVMTYGISAIDMGAWNGPKPQRKILKVKQLTRINLLIVAL